MSATQIVIYLLGDISLLLWGIHMVHSGVLRAFGPELRRLLSVGLKTRFHAFLAGLGVTAALQSSTATGLMAASFVGDGLVGLLPALALMLGANVGTALIVQVFSFDITLVFPILLFAGTIAFRRGSRTRVRDIGRVAIGLGLMLLALHLMAEAIQPVEGAAVARELMAAITRDPLLNFVLAAAFTWAAHSSVAAILFIMPLAGASIISPETAIAMVLGANLGSAINPVLEGTAGDPVKLRLPVGNFITRIVGCLLVLPFLTPLTQWMASIDPLAARMVADFHFAFNMALALIFIGPLSLMARLLTRLFPAKAQLADPATPRYLSREALEMPTIALSNATREALRVADVTETMMRGSQEIFHTGDRKRVSEINRMDNIVDKLHEEIEHYLTALSSDLLSEADGKRLSEILAFTINLEHIGDIIEKSLLSLASKQIKHRFKLLPTDLSEIDQMYARLLNNLQLAITVFTSGDVAAARRLVQEKEGFRELERGATERHFERIRDGRTDGSETSGLHLDIVRDLKRIESHIAAAAYPVLEQSEMLRQSRLI